MTENIKVVVIPEAKEEAYNMGYDRFQGIPEEEVYGENLSHFKEYATFCNSIHPGIRAMSGYSDSGHGTYTINGQVVTVEYPEDRPMDGEITEATYVEQELMEAFDCGAYDAMDGKDRYERLDW